MSKMKGEYHGQDKEIMVQAAKAKSKSRLQELINFAKEAGFKKIGIAHCITVKKYAERLAELLRAENFEVYAIDCRESGLRGEEVCDILTGSCCDPVSQAQYLNALQTDFNIDVGLCLGHGLLFQKHSKAPVTTFLVKDFAHKHNTAAVLSEE